jgi:poly(3-hydroxybutyrate) depolymerase
MTRARWSLGFLGLLGVLGCGGGSGSGAAAGAGGGAAGVQAGGGTSGAAGSAGTGEAGATATAGGTGATGEAGATPTGGGAGGGTAGGRPHGPSAGCNLPPASNDSPTAFVKHDVTVTGVDPAFVAAHPPDPSGGTNTWAKRNYFLRLPTKYDPAHPYVVSLGGTGCSGNDNVGSSGGYYLGEHVAAARSGALEVSLSYVVYQNTTKPSCFADDYVNSPEPQYIDAVLADLETRYCVDRDKVFIHGHSSGAWEALTMGCARADVLRGVATQVGGGLRLHRPACQKTPVATIYVEGLQDTDNPIGPLAPTDAKALDLDSLGSAPARDDLLTRNGCVGNATAAWDAAYPACVKYTGCPVAAPVIWCAIATAHNVGANPTLRDQYAYNAIWKLWTTLP